LDAGKHYGLTADWEACAKNWQVRKYIIVFSSLKEQSNYFVGCGKIHWFGRRIGGRCQKFASSVTSK
jgi:hypothetical protein